MKTELKPCPFCGGEAKHNVAHLWHSIECTRCGASTTWRSTKRGARRLWDRRAPKQPKQRLPIGTRVKVSGWLKEPFMARVTGYDECYVKDTRVVSDKGVEWIVGVEDCEVLGKEGGG